MIPSNLSFSETIKIIEDDLMQSESRRWEAVNHLLAKLDDVCSTLAISLDQLDEIDPDKEEQLEFEISDLNSEISRLEDRVDELEAENSTLQSEIYSLEEKIEKLEAQVSDLEDRL